MVEGRIFDEKTNKTIKKRAESPADNVSPHTSITPKRGEIPPKHPKSATAVTLVEVALATLLMAVGFLGATSYRYYAALDEQRATMWRSAARIGLLFSDSWRGLKGSETYDPLAHVGSGLDIKPIAGSEAPDGFNLKGTYVIATDRHHYFATLSWKQVEPELKALNVVVNWMPSPSAEADLAGADKSFKLTTYIED